MTKIITKSAREAIRENPEWFIGDVKSPTHLVIEVLDNAIDEVYNNFANYIKIEINTKEKYISITDNGRGIPNKNDEPIKIAENLFTSGKFKDNKSTNKYNISIGKHGVGLKAVNFLSTDMIITSKTKNGKIKQYIFKDGKFIEKNIINNPQIKTTFSKVKFSPDLTIFESFDIDIRLIKDRLKILKLYRPMTKLVILIDDKEEEIEYFKDKETFYKNMLNIKDDNLPSINISINKPNGEYFELYLTFDFNYNNSLFKSDINLLPIESGTHISLVEKILKEIFDIKKLYFIKGFMTLFMDRIAFSGQNKKTFAITDKQFNKVFNIKQIKKLIIDKLKETIVDNIPLFDLYKLKYQEHIEHKNIKSILKNKKDKINQTNLKFKNCKAKSGATLFIVEGDSAAGNITKIRNPKNEAIFPIQGKILNVENSTIDKMIKNNEVISLINVIGEYAFYKNKLLSTESKPKFSKIAILTDPDGDGYHIALLLTILFKTLMPEIIDSGRLYYIKTPLYGAVKTTKRKREFISIQDEKDREKYKSKGYTIIRHKGLGEFNPDDLRMVIDDPNNWINII